MIETSSYIHTNLSDWHFHENSVNIEVRSAMNSCMKKYGLIRRMLDDEEDSIREERKKIEKMCNPENREQHTQNYIERAMRYALLNHMAKEYRMHGIDLLTKYYNGEASASDAVAFSSELNKLGIMVRQTWDMGYPYYGTGGPI